MDGHMKTEPGTESIISLAAAIREEANTLILRLLAARGITDILPAHGAVLHALFRQSPIQMGALAAMIGRKKNTVTGLINTLEERGYCRREPDPLDARAQKIALTDKGEALRGIQDEISAELLRSAWRGIPVSEQRAAMRSLTSILNNLKQDKRNLI